ncbi:alpha/beta hydrolase [Micromonospora sp. SH-82]|uniref:alpha/beta hydrolase n=1 Tax=Micromonospora sp. SH-82 TaxID=3132938 RepID=UPI003EBB5113
MKRSRIVGRGMAVTVAVGLVATLTTVPAAADEPVSQVQWGACPAPVAAVSPSLQCATVPVPLDYGDPTGTAIEIMVSRIASQNPTERRGILLLNPGGPGGSGLTMPADLVNLGLPATVLDRYDLIGLDPRGVGQSAPVSCSFTGDLDYRGNIPPYAVDDAAVAAQATIAKTVAERCAANDTEGRLRHLTTANTARDLNSIRVALGEEKASFYGASYGSALGAAYASMFPDTTDRVVVDSNVGDTHLSRAGLRRFGLGMEQTFPDFAAWAAARHGAYGLGRNPAQVTSNYFTLAERLDRTPVAGVDGATFRLLNFTALYSEAQYGLLAQTWQALRNSDGAAVTRLMARAADPAVAQRTNRAEDPAELLPWDNNWSAFLAVTCNDSAWPEKVARYQDSAATDREKFPMYGAAGANITPCAYWPHEPSEPPVSINDDGPPNVLILQNRRDPATPLRGGKLLREKFEDRSRLVTVDGSGHGVYVFGDNACALNVTTAYLVDGTMPEDRFCGPGTRTFTPEAAQQRADTLDRLHRTP